MDALQFVAKGIGATLGITLILYISFRVISAAYFKSKQEYLRRIKEHG